MSYTKPPCWKGGKDCESRYIACQSSCEEFQAWLAIHAEEKAKEKQKRQQEHELLAVVSTHGERSRRTKRAIYDAKRRA